MTQRQSSNLSYILVGVVAVVAVVVLLTNNPARLEGAVTAISGPADSFSPFCVDDDDKNVYSKFGTVHFGSKEYYDFCQDEKTLKQWYCASTNSKRVTKSFKCPNGCKDGVCR